MFKELSSVHKIAAKRTLREWMAKGVPKAVAAVGVTADEALVVAVARPVADDGRHSKIES